MDVVVVPFLTVLRLVISLYTWVVIGAVVVTWLYALRILNTGSPIVDTISSVLFRVTDPVLAHIRRFLPNLSGVDLSPVILLFALYFADIFLVRLLMRFSF